MINVVKHKGMLTALASKYVADLEKLRFVPDVGIEGEQLGAGSDVSTRTGKCLRNSTTGKHLILIAEKISASTKESIISGMMLRGSKSEDLELLDNDCNFIKHLVLHECAHANDSEFSELECDNWAFERLRTEI